MSPNLTAFLAVIRACEGTEGEEGFRAIFGWRPGNGRVFTSFADHPRIKVPYGQTYTTAAGAYQMLASTYDDAKAHTGVPDFSPESQDRCAVYLVQRRGALQDVEAGRLRAAIERCNKEWASLPGSPYGQPTRDLAYCERIFAANGGHQIDGNTVYGGMSGEAANPPPPDHAGTASPPLSTPQKEPRMGALAGLLPVIFQLFSARGTAAVERISGLPEQEAAKAFAAIGSKVQEVVGFPVTDAASAAKAVASVVADPAKVAAVEDTTTHYALVEVSGGVGGARQATADYVKGLEDDEWWRPPLKFICTPINWVTGAILYQLDPFMRQLATMFPGLSESVRATITASIVTLLVGAVCGYWLGMYVQKSKE